MTMETYANKYNEQYHEDIFQYSTVLVCLIKQECKLSQVLIATSDARQKNISMYFTIVHE